MLNSGPLGAQNRFPGGGGLGVGMFSGVSVGVCELGVLEKVELEVVLDSVVKEVELDASVEETSAEVELELVLDSEVNEIELDVSVGEASAGDVTVGEASAGDVSVDDVSVDGASSDDASVDDTSVENVEDVELDVEEVELEDIDKAEVDDLEDVKVEDDEVSLYEDDVVEASTVELNPILVVTVRVSLSENGVVIASSVELVSLLVLVEVDENEVDELVLDGVVLEGIEGDDVDVEVSELVELRLLELPNLVLESDELELEELEEVDELESSDGLGSSVIDGVVSLPVVMLVAVGKDPVESISEVVPLDESVSEGKAPVVLSPDWLVSEIAGVVVSASAVDGKEMPILKLADPPVLSRLLDVWVVAPVAGAPEGLISKVDVVLVRSVRLEVYPVVAPIVDAWEGVMVDVTKFDSVGVLKASPVDVTGEKLGPAVVPGNIEFVTSTDEESVMPEDIMP
jgi:hypothetical protein